MEVFFKKWEWNSMHAQIILVLLVGAELKGDLKLPDKTVTTKSVIQLRLKLSK